MLTSGPPLLIPRLFTLNFKRSFETRHQIVQFGLKFKALLSLLSIAVGIIATPGDGLHSCQKGIHFCY